MLLQQSVMEEVVQPVSMRHVHSKPLVTWSVTTFLVISVIGIFVTWYAKILWTRRKLYRFSGKLTGPFALPVIGSTIYFLGNTHSKQTISSDFFVDKGYF